MPLYITRRVGESIDIGKGIRVAVRAINGRQAQLSLEVPDGVHVRRSELTPLCTCGRGRMGCELHPSTGASHETARHTTTE